MNSTDLIQLANKLKAQRTEIMNEGESILVRSESISADFEEFPNEENRERLKANIAEIQTIREKGEKLLEEINNLLPLIEQKQKEEKAEMLEIQNVLDGFMKRNGI